MTENQGPNTASSRYKRQIRIAAITVFIVELVVVLIAVYKFRQ